MASNKTPSYSNGKLRLKIFSSSSPKVPSTPSQSPPPPPTGLTMNTQKASMISSLTPEVQLFHEQVFKALPQAPHFNKLENFTSESESLKQGIKLGCDVAFMNLVMKFQNLVDPFDFLTKVENFTDEFKGFEELGYDLTKIKERFNLLKRRAEQEQELKDEVERLDEEKKQREVELAKKELLLMELTKEVKIKMEKSEVESIDDKKKKIMDASNMSVDGFRNLASNPW